MTVPPPPPQPPTIHLPQQDAEPEPDWWDRLYQDTHPTPPDPAPAPVPAADERPADRIQSWWTGRHVDLTKPHQAEEDEDDGQAVEEDQEQEGEGEGECEHPTLLPLVVPITGETVAYLCTACDAQLPADENGDVEPEPQTEAQRPSRSRWLPAGAQGMSLNPRARRVLYNGSAAGLGWYLGLGPNVRDFVSACGREAGAVPALIVGLAICGSVALLIDRRTRHWWAPLAWVLRAPLAAVALALALSPF
ncbi:MULTISPECIES: hypothetical protein [Streptomyces]|uniref:hypothetical protein n=1 Tax=Streptomyces TaxID=1883 RepID=UPI000B9EDD68|nr:hypothetical protein [Streptomyces kasugaensis]